MAEADGDLDALAATFTEDARVQDERETHVGRDAIRTWRLGVAARHRFTTEVLSAP